MGSKTIRGSPRLCKIHFALPRESKTARQTRESGEYSCRCCHTLFRRRSWFLAIVVPGNSPSEHCSEIALRTIDQSGSPCSLAEPKVFEILKSIVSGAIHDPINSRMGPKRSVRPSLQIIYDHSQGHVKGRSSIRSLSSRS